MVDGKKITVLRILRMWFEEGKQDRKRKRFYIAEGSDGFVHRLYYDMKIEDWFHRGIERPALMIIHPCRTVRYRFFALYIFQPLPQ